MKRFVKIALITSVVMAAFGVACLIGAFAMGLSTDSFRDMLDRGKFSFNFGEGASDVSDMNETTSEVDKNFLNLDIEYGAGNLKIYYADVDELQIKQRGIYNCGWMVHDLTLSIEGSSGMKHGANGYLEIIIPRDKQLKEVELSLGASKAEVIDLAAENVSIEVGAGEAVFTNLNAQMLDAETGVGRLEIQMAGDETDYNYDIECGIGAIKIGKNSYAGLGTVNEIEHPNAEKYIFAECGVGEIELSFVE